MIIYNQNSVKQKLGSSSSLRAHGLGGASATFFYYFPLFQSAEGGLRFVNFWGSAPLATLFKYNELFPVINPF